MPHRRAILYLTPLELLDRLALLIPPPRRHRHRYDGVFAPNAPLQAQVTAWLEDSPADAPPTTDDPDPGEPHQPPTIQPPRGPPDWIDADEPLFLDEDLDQNRYGIEFDQRLTW